MALIDITIGPLTTRTPWADEWWGTIDIEWSEQPHEHQWRRWHLTVPELVGGWLTFGPFS